MSLLAFVRWFMLLLLVSLSHGMDYVTIGNPALRFSRLILGTDHLGKGGEEQATAVLNEALRLGINAFDTAPIYSESIEMILGAWLRSLERNDLFVITKGGFPVDTGPGTYQSRLKGSVDEIAANVFEELKGSRAMYSQPITIYLMHRDDNDYLDYKRIVRERTPADTILRALSLSHLASQYQMIGLSNWENSRVEEALSVQIPGVLRPVCRSPYFSLLEMSDVTIHSGGVQVKHEDMMNPDFQKGIRIMTYSPLGGFPIFSRSWEEAEKEALTLKNEDERYWGHVYDAIFHEANKKRWKRLEQFTQAFNQKHQSHYTMDQMAHAWVLAHPRSDFMIIGPRNIEQLRRTVGALELSKHLSSEDLDYLYRNELSNSE
jgi:aryl-alcohol dehydrogenase-like predicted oxidoreductase